MDNAKVAEILETIGRILEIQGENPFKVRAYHTAARTISGLGTDLRKCVEEKTLGELPGIGPALVEKITQLFTTGTMEYYETLRKGVPAGVLDLLRIPSVGPKKVAVLWKEKGITSLEELRRACEENRIAGLKGFGEKTQKKILEGIAFVAAIQGQFRLNEAMPVAKALVGYLRECPDVQRVSLAGSLRRWKEVVRDVDLLVSSRNPAAVMRHFLKADGMAEVLAQGETKASVRRVNGLQVDLRVVSDDEFPPALAYFTGSKEHNVAIRQIAQKQGLKVNEYGIFRGETRLPCGDEEEFYQTLGLPYIPPELRENTGEIEATSLPALIGFDALKGVFHTHSVWSDGTASIEEMARKARAIGLSYMGISDHSKAASYANGMDETRLRDQMKEVRRLNATLKDFRILQGLECDILPNGELDLEPGLLGELDFVIGSIHSRFDMSETEMTERICKALTNNNLDMLGHPTGRLLLGREGYRVDLDRVIETAQRCNKIIELNAHPNRLDLDAVHCRRARERGVMVSINPDAHDLAGIEDIEYGLATARRGWLEAGNVLNSRPLDEALKILAR